MQRGKLNFKSAPTVFYDITSMLALEDNWWNTFCGILDKWKWTRHLFYPTLKKNSCAVRYVMVHRMKTVFENERFVCIGPARLQRLVERSIKRIEKEDHIRFGPIKSCRTIKKFHEYYNDVNGCVFYTSNSQWWSDEYACYNSPWQVNGNKKMINFVNKVVNKDSGKLETIRLKEAKKNINLIKGM